MTDSRVTPQAIQAAAEAVAAYWDALREHPAEPDENDYGQAEEVLAAAAPLLCQPLQDEIDRLRAECDRWRRVAEYGWHLHNYGENAPGGTETWREFEAMIRAAAGHD